MLAATMIVHGQMTCGLLDFCNVQLFLGIFAFEYSTL